MARTSILEVQLFFSSQRNSTNDIYIYIYNIFIYIYIGKENIKSFKLKENSITIIIIY